MNFFKLFSFISLSILSILEFSRPVYASGPTVVHTKTVNISGGTEHTRKVVWSAAREVEVAGDTAPRRAQAFNKLRSAENAYVKSGGTVTRFILGGTDDTQKSLKGIHEIFSVDFSKSPVKMHLALGAYKKLSADHSQAGGLVYVVPDKGDEKLGRAFHRAYRGFERSLNPNNPLQAYHAAIQEHEEANGQIFVRAGTADGKSPAARSLYAPIDHLDSFANFRVLDGIGTAVRAQYQMQANDAVVSRKRSRKTFEQDN